MTIPVRTLRELLRNLQMWQALYETTGTDTLRDHDGNEYCLHDIVRLYETGVPRLSPRQRQAIQMFLIDNLPEREVARRMGVSEDNPVASYATQGMLRLNQMISAGEIPGFDEEAAPLWKALEDAA